MVKKKNNANENTQKYLALVKSELDAFAFSNGTIASEFENNERFGAFESVMMLGETEVHFFADEAIMMGYRFIEGNDTEQLPCLITRFKFPFSDYYFTPYDVHNALGLSDFKTLDFHYLTDEKMQKYALSAMLHFLTVNRRGIDAIGKDVNLQRALIDGYEHDLKLVSKRITKEKLDKDFMKYTNSHEIDMYFHNNLAEPLTNFISKGKVTELSKRFDKLDRKNKLLTFEKRYYEFLKARNFEAPQDYSFSANKEIHRTQKVTARVNAAIEAVSIILILIIGVVVSIASETVTAGERTVIDSNGFFDRSVFLFFLAIVAMSFLIMLSAGKPVYKRFSAKNIFDNTKPVTRAVVAVICIGVIFGYCFAEWGASKKIAALGNNDIFIGYAFDEGEALPYNSDRLTFVLQEGITDDNEQPEYRNSIDDKTLYIIVDNDFEKQYDTDNYECDLQKVMDKLEESGAAIDRVADLRAFEKKYNPDYDPSDWE